MKKTSRIARAAVVGAAYAAITVALPFWGFGPVQFRVSEALCVLPFFFPEAVFGLYIGCLLANFIGLSLGFTVPWDLLFGATATLIAAFLTSKIKIKWLAPLPPVILNALIVGTMLTVFILPGVEKAPLYFNILTVGAGEALVCYALGLPLLLVIEKTGLHKKLQYHSDGGNKSDS